MLVKTKFRTLKLAIELYHRLKRERFSSRHMQDQFDRALLSVVLNLSEGSAKPTHRDRLKFYSIAFGSLREVQVLLEISDKQQQLAASDHLAASLYCLCRSLKNKCLN